ncbi:MAG: FAD-binding oxidoreductase [Rhodospirillales bacterium]|jgi:alkyldihydroxyacetonephosphate synthase|nr:FAD-binding oxidoreductase [Rhodospirillales bacterium]
MVDMNQGTVFSTAVEIETARKVDDEQLAPSWIASLQAEIPSVRLHSDFDTLLEHSRDRLPFGRFRHRSKQLTGALPSAVVEPTNVAEVEEIVQFAQRNNLAVIPYGSGSGVLGGTVPFCGELIIALNRMNRILEIDETNNVVRAEAGLNGGALEVALKERGYSSGHSPQSLEMSTVGGWAACRGSGQCSSRYGNIENMIVGMKVVLPSGELMDVRHVPRRSVGPSLIELFIGSEGTLGLVVEVTLKIWPLPPKEIDGTVAFPGVESGLHAIRKVMQLGLRPAVIRLYDRSESERWGGDDLPDDPDAVICMFEFHGLAGVAEAEFEAALRIFATHGGVIIDDGPIRRWKSVRFESHSDAFVDAGGYYDTIEVAAPWSRLVEMYNTIRSAISDKYPEVMLNAHWSHAYSDGACMYMTTKIPAMPDEAALPIHASVWEIVMRHCLDMGGTISHHHGIGYFRNKWIIEELNAGHKVLGDLKRALDPGNLFNPGKLGLTDKD